MHMQREEIGDSARPNASHSRLAPKLSYAIYLTLSPGCFLHALCPFQKSRGTHEGSLYNHIRHPTRATLHMQKAPSKHSWGDLYVEVP